MDINSMYYTIGQVAEHVNLPQSVLRYWESVFDVLTPQKSKGGNRRYSKNDIEIILKIKELLYEQGFTIKGANKQLNKIFGGDSQAGQSEVAIPSRQKRAGRSDSPDIEMEDKGKADSPSRVSAEAKLNRIKNRLREIIQILDEG